MALDYRSAALAALLLGSAGVASAVSPDQLPERIRSAQAALDRLQADYARLRSQGVLSRTEDRDYAAYLQGLAARIGTDCLTLARQHAGALPPDLPCTALRAPLPTRPDRTPAEQLARLEDQLGSSLGEFDQMLLQEQARIKADAPAGGAGAGGGGAGGQAGTGSGSAGGSGDQEQTGSGAQSEAGAETADIGDTADPQSGAAGSRPSSTAAGQPSDLPDGSDDDVVARQLREAAEKEQDPELQRRLWEEYRRYKNGK